MSPDGANLQAIGVLTRSTTHDINNCMSAILAFAELVLESLPADHPSRTAVLEILRTSHCAVVKTRELDHIARRLAPIGRSS